ncbi:hypothetical protein EPN16_02565 [bacterium]|nr:MAG: hypothetical protein EPN16_02565 [bacterium]
MFSKLKYIRDFIFIQKCIPWRISRFISIKAKECYDFFCLTAKKWTETEYIEEWSIAIYKMTLSGKTFKLANDTANNKPALTRRDTKNRMIAYVADPFLVFNNGIYNMFFEALKNCRGIKKGIIGLATSDNLKRWKFKKIVLEEPFHLSYPNIFYWEGKFYMLPESQEAKAVRLYEAIDFPEKWKFVKILLDGKNFVDPTIFHFMDKFWMFLSDTSNCILYLYYADSLDGAWKEHPKSPIIKDDSSKARPAGNVLFIENRLIRLAQNYFKSYGYAVRAFEITKLDTEEYEEKELPESPLIKGTDIGWNKDGMHHLSVHQVREKEWVASVDGKKVYERYKYLKHAPPFLTRFLAKISQNA